MADERERADDLRRLCVECDEETSEPGDVLCLWCREAEDDWDDYDPDELDPY